MKTSKTPKIVIGVGLVGVYSAILSVVILRDGHHSAVAANPPSEPPAFVGPGAADPAQSAATETASAPPPTDAETTVPEQSVATPLPAAPVEHSTPKTVVAKASRPADTDTVASASEPAAASAPSEAPLAAEASRAPVNTDSLITAEVKSEVAAVNPGGNIDVATRDGVVALTGSVPSQDVIDKVSLVARNIPAVKDVDVSALMITN